MTKYLKNKLVKLSNGQKILLREATHKEKWLNRKCVLAWEFQNNLGEKFVFAKFKNNKDNIIVTLGSWNNSINKYIPQW